MTVNLLDATQELANEFPPWSNTRADEQSIGFQLLNVLAAPLDDIKKQLITVGKNYFLQTANLDEIDLIYRYNLAPNFVFNGDFSDPANPIYTPPTVTGTYNSNPYTVTIAENNDIETFWYTSVPTRIASISGANTLSYSVLSDILQNSPWTTLNPLFEAGKLWVTIAGGTNFITLEGENVIRASVIIEGITRKGTTESETLIFLWDNTVTTSKEWQSITSIAVYGVTPSTATISVESMYHGNQYLDFYNIRQSVYNNQNDTWYTVGQNDNNIATLNVVQYSNEDPNTLIQGLTGQEIIRSIQLLDVNGNPITVTACAVQPFNDKIYVAGKESGIWNLYCFDNTLATTDTSQMTLKQNDAISILEPSSYHVVNGDTIDLAYSFIRPVNQVVSQVATALAPNGTLYGLNNGFVSSSSDYTILGQTGQGRLLRPDDLLVLNQVGDWLFTLTVTYIDGSSSIDQRVVSVETKKALAQYSINSIAGALNTISYMMFDSDQVLWIENGNGQRYSITFGWDVMIVDYAQKVIYFKDPYSAVTISA